ncbi:MAG: histidinol dehydrogenase [Planctomycetota bacterium]|nr:histidinol dehydrogenase [Planctomycetota bacterium]
MLPLVRAGTPAAQHLLEKLNGRLAAMEALDSAPYRARVKKLFGKVLRPDEVVARILGEVRARGDKAIFDYAKRIDGVKLSAKNLRVSRAEIKAGFKRTPKPVREALVLAAHRIAEYQQKILPSHVAPGTGCCGPEGVKVGLAWSPIRRAGLYVPGGTAAYPSSVLHNALPALVAGVKELAVATPCGPDGNLSDGVLCACAILGIDEVYRVGGAQAVGAFAYGTGSIPRVEKIVGPGNLFVMLAKRAVFGHVDIDMLAGPSEVLVLADRTANPAWVAADLLAQAEHDVLASCVLLTDSLKLATAVQSEIERQLKDLPRREIAAAAVRDWGAAVVTKDLAQAVTLANDLAPEHLELQTAKPNKLVPRLTTAGAIFIGPHATEPLGDYLAGPSHTLPTGGTARAFSGVSVYTFLRRTSLIVADGKGLEALAPAIETLAEAEGLEAHRRAVAVRGAKK